MNIPRVQKICGNIYVCLFIYGDCIHRWTSSLPNIVLVFRHDVSMAAVDDWPSGGGGGGGRGTWNNRWWHLAINHKRTGGAGHITNCVAYPPPQPTRVASVLLLSTFWIGPFHLYMSYFWQKMTIITAHYNVQNVTVVRDGRSRQLYKMLVQGDYLTTIG